MNANQTETNEDQWIGGLRYHCRKFVVEVMRYQQVKSSDLLETLVEQLVDVSRHHAGFAHDMYGDWEVVTRAIDYLAHIHDGPWQGVDWFKTSLGILLELAVPNTGMTEDSAAFLPDLQRGIAQSFQGAPVQRRSMQLSDEDVALVMTLRDAGQEYGLVSDLLDVCEKLTRGEPMGHEDQWILKLAANAAPFTRVARSGN